MSLETLAALLTGTAARTNHMRKPSVADLARWKALDEAEEREARALAYIYADPFTDRAAWNAQNREDDRMETEIEKAKEAGIRSIPF